MATNRKLQAEIDRVLKRVSEGMEEFDQIWEKVHTASTPNLKEKYEADLKKEIKKLQRYRDQIKSWVSSSDVKNKTPLLEARKNIENEMERFKVLEKETKTKAYSKEGLSLVTKKKTDPRSDPKYETISWIRKAVKDLKGQIETMQKASANKAKKGKPKTKGATEPEESPINWIERHQWQVEQLSKNKRRLEKGEVTIQQVQDIKDDVGYYIESNQNPDFFEDEFLYNALDEAAAASGALDDDYEIDPDFGTDDEYSDEEEEEDNYEATPKQGAQTEDGSHLVPTLVVPPPLPGTTAASLPVKPGTKTPPPSSIIGSLSGVNGTNGTTVSTTTPILAPATPTQGKPPVPPSVTLPPVTVSATPAVKATPRVPAVRPIVPAPATSVPRPSVATPKVAPVPTPQPPPQTAQPQVPRAPLVKGTRTGSGPPSPTLTATVHLPPSQQPTQPQAAYPQPTPNQQQLQATQQQLQQQLQRQFQQLELQQRQESNPQTPHQPQSMPATTQPAPTQSTAPQASLLQPQPQLSHPAHPQQTQQQQLQNQQPTHQQALPQSHAQPQRQLEHPLHQQNQPQLQHAPTAQQRHPQPPGGPSGQTSSQQLPPASQLPQGLAQRPIVDEDYLYNLKMLEPSLRHTPDPRDSERPKQYAPRNPYRTPPYFPAVPAPVFDDPAIFEKFSTDTLFFIFYFQQGTPHQYLAARELKKQSWRYHKNFLTWFQRHDEPKLSTEEYEQGAYVYFDYESGWSTSIKTDFTFEYRHLEDELWVPTNASL